MLALIMMWMEGKVHLSPGSTVEEHNLLGWGEDSGKDGTRGLSEEKVRHAQGILSLMFCDPALLRRTHFFLQFIETEKTNKQISLNLTIFLRTSTLHLSQHLEDMNSNNC